MAYDFYVTIGGVQYTRENIKSLRTYGGLFSSDTPGVGGCEGRQFDLTIIPKTQIPRMAEVTVFVRDVDNKGYYKGCGVFYIDSRRWNYQENTLTLHGYDAMLKMDRFLYRALPDGWEDNFSWNSIEVMQAIAAYIGCELDTANVYNGPIYDEKADAKPGGETPSDSVRDTEGDDGGGESGGDEIQNNAWYGLKKNILSRLKMRTVAKHIAAASGGNWKINRGGKLVLNSIGFRDASEHPEHRVDLMVGTYWKDTSALPWSGVKFTYSGMPEVTAGDTSGRQIIAECPFATQELAQKVFNLAKTFPYFPFEATGAHIPPWAELGDVVLIGDPEFDAWTYPHPLARIETNFDALCVSEIAAPDDGEYNHEFPPEDSDPLSDEQKQAIQDLIDDTLDSDGLTANLIINYTYVGQTIYTERYQYAEGYSYNLATHYVDVERNTLRRIYYPLRDEITGTLESDTTETVITGLALELDLNTRVLAIFDVDSVNMSGDNIAVIN